MKWHFYQIQVFDYDVTYILRLPDCWRWLCCKVKRNNGRLFIGDVQHNYLHFPMTLVLWFIFISGLDLVVQAIAKHNVIIHCWNKNLLETWTLDSCPGALAFEPLSAFSILFYSIWSLIGVCGRILATRGIIIPVQWLFISTLVPTLLFELLYL